MLEAKLHQVIDTEYSADVCVFNPDRSILAVGTYQLKENDQENESRKGADEIEDPEVGDKLGCHGRLGRLYFYKVIRQDETKKPSFLLVETQRMEWSSGGGILDIKWLPSLSSILSSTCTPSSLSQLCVADSMGKVSILRLNPQQNKFEIVECINIVEKSKLCLALDWSSASSSSSLAVSTSDGGACVVDLDAKRVVTRVNAHTFETWCVHLTGTSGMYTGGDDACLKRWDLRTPSITGAVHHDAGVTSIASLGEHVLLSGSYDQHLRAWDPRHFRRPLHTFVAQGGVWRIRPHHNHLALAAMHGGCQVLKYDPYATLEKGTFP